MYSTSVKIGRSIEVQCDPEKWPDKSSCGMLMAELWSNLRTDRG